MAAAPASAQKYLHELLKEDQEPFQLKNYISDRRCQLRRSSVTNNPAKNTSLAVQVKRRKPIMDTTTTSTISKRNICKHACFLSFNDSPDVRKSPFLDFKSPAKSPCSRTQNGTVFLHVPARTAALLLEAAMRIQKQQSSSSPTSKPKSQIKNVGFGLFSSIIKKLKDRNRSKKCEIQDAEFEIPRRSANKMEETVAVASSTEGCSCSCNNSRLSSAGWSESNEEKSLDMETSTSSCRSQDSQGLDSVAAQDSAACENLFCSSPLSPFRFSLQRSPSYCGHRTPDFSSPAASPRRQEKNKYEGNGFEEIKELEAEEEEEEEKEQCSPVSVLDTPFEDEDEEYDGHDVDENENGEDDEDYDLECSFAIVERAKEQLLHKLRRFEKLAELDPIELEKRMMEQLDEDDENEGDDVEEEKCTDTEFLPLYRGCSLDSFVNEVCIKSSLQNRRKLPTDMKRLVSDLISEEKREFKFLENKEIVLGRVCKKLDSWKEVESNTIDMMVALDFQSEVDEWKRFREQREETAMEIELAIFGVLVKELSEELQ